jgi:hypothetical protein
METCSGTYKITSTESHFMGGEFAIYPSKRHVFENIDEISNRAGFFMLTYSTLPLSRIRYLRYIIAHVPPGITREMSSLHARGVYF